MWTTLRHNLWNWLVLLQARFWLQVPLCQKIPKTSVPVLPVHVTITAWSLQLWRDPGHRTCGSGGEGCWRDSRDDCTISWKHDSPISSDENFLQSVNAKRVADRASSRNQIQQQLQHMQSHLQRQLKLIGKQQQKFLKKHSKPNLLQQSIACWYGAWENQLVTADQQLPPKQRGNSKEAST